MLTPDTMTDQQLRDEVHYWRAAVACHIGVAIAAYDNPPTDPEYARHLRERDLSGWVSYLSDALEGAYHPLCEGCLEPVRPGDPVICYADVGEVHADCNGKAYKVGDRIPVDLDSLDLEEGETPPVDPHFTVYAASAFYDTDRLAANLETGRAALLRIRADREAAQAAQPQPLTEEA